MGKRVLTEADLVRSVLLGRQAAAWLARTNSQQAEVVIRLVEWTELALAERVLTRPAGAELDQALDRLQAMMREIMVALERCSIGPH